MKEVEFLALRQKVIDAGYGDEIVWAESCQIVDSPEAFLREYIWVVISSGIKNQVAGIIYRRVIKAMDYGAPLIEAFKHKGKVEAINQVIKQIQGIYQEWKQSKYSIDYLASLPFIGNITKYHLARNLGLDCVKPDRHLVRISQNYCTTPNELCKKLSWATGYRIGTVDVILWRAANLGMV